MQSQVKGQTGAFLAVLPQLLCTAEELGSKREGSSPKAALSHCRLVLFGFPFVQVLFIGFFVTLLIGAFFFFESWSDKCFEKTY